MNPTDCNDISSMWYLAKECFILLFVLVFRITMLGWLVDTMLCQRGGHDFVWHCIYLQHTCIFKGHYWGHYPIGHNLGSNMSGSFQLHTTTAFCIGGLKSDYCSQRWFQTLCCTYVIVVLSVHTEQNACLVVLLSSHLSSCKATGSNLRCSKKLLSSHWSASAPFQWP